MRIAWWCFRQYRKRWKRVCIYPRASRCAAGNKKGRFRVKGVVILLRSAKMGTWRTLAGVASKWIINPGTLTAECAFIRKTFPLIRCILHIHTRNPSLRRKKHIIRAPKWSCEFRVPKGVPALLHQRHFVPLSRHPFAFHGQAFDGPRRGYLPCTRALAPQDVGHVLRLPLRSED